MLYIKSNFQLPNSDVQLAETFVTVERNEANLLQAFWYAEKELINLMSIKLYEYDGELSDYEYLLTLDLYKDFELLEVK